MSFPRGHALVIGVSQQAYAPGQAVPQLTEDTRMVAERLRDARICGYPAGQVTVLDGPRATRAAILAALAQLAARVQPDDTVLLIYGGHGLRSGDSYYLTTYDLARAADGQVRDGTGIRQDELLVALQAIRAERLLVIINACHAGSVSPVALDAADTDPGDPLPDDTAAALLGTGTGRILITACRANQYAFIGTGPTTIFGQALIDGLEGKGTVSSRGGTIGVFDLYLHLYDAVGAAIQALAMPEAVRRRYGTVQQPQLTITRGVGPFPVALYRGATTLGDDAEAPAFDDATAPRQVPARVSGRLFQQLTGDLAAGRDNRIVGTVETYTEIAGNQIATQHGDIHIHLDAPAQDRVPPPGTAPAASSHLAQKLAQLQALWEQLDLQAASFGAFAPAYLLVEKIRLEREIAEIRQVMQG